MKKLSRWIKAPQLKYINKDTEQLSPLHWVGGAYGLDVREKVEPRH